MRFNRKDSSFALSGSLLAMALLLATVCTLFSSGSKAHAQTCPGVDDQPTPTEVGVTAVPIVVESTTADYFVLYVSHDVDGETVEYPVQVIRGEDGTTTLAENVAPLPMERYRVEKYLIADPADVDRDCTDDITELGSTTDVSPLNPAVALELSDGAVAVPDQETFEALAYHAPSGALHVKFSIVNKDTDRPSVYFQDTNRFPHHDDFLDSIDIDWDYSTTAKGTIVYDPGLVAPDGSRGLYRYYYQGRVREQHFHSLVPRVYTLLAANMPLLEDNLAMWIHSGQLKRIQVELPIYRASRMNLVFDADVYGETTFQALNPGEGYGLLRSLDPDERPHSRDVVIYEALPNDLPRVAGIISTVPQTPLSHVNLRALQDNVPNAFIRYALENDAVSDLVGSHVYYAVTKTGYTIRAATQAEVDAHFASSRPTEAQTPQRDLTATAITPLGDIGFDDWDSFGVKAANVALLRTLGFPEGTVPDGFAVPFYFYDEFMKHNDLYDDIEEMLADSDFQSDYDTKADELKKLRKRIKKAETPEWIETALTTMHATFPEGTSLRYRSSTNNEDLAGFNGAGLYDSKTQHPEETEEDGISKSLKQVYASLWNFRAFIERDFHRVDHMAAAMGVLVHPNFSDELVNGVAVSVDPSYGTEGTFYVNSQVGEDLVTNPEAHSVPEEVLLYPDGTYAVAALSNQAQAGQMLMIADQLGQLRRHLGTIHERFADLYGIEDSERFAMEIEFKITSDNVLVIKQARLWIFASPPTALDNALAEDPGVALAASLEDPPATHDGNPFSVRFQFSEFITFRDPRHAVTVMGGRVTAWPQGGMLQGNSLKLQVTPDSPIPNVTLVLAHNRPCTISGAFCTYSGRRLSNRLEHTVESLLPRAPNRPTGRTLASDTVELEWNDVFGADFYEVQLLHGGQRIDLPANGTEIAFDGDGAVVRGLPPSHAYIFRVRAVNSYRASEWSPHLFVPIRLDLQSELTAGQDTDILPVRSGHSIYGNLGGTLSPDRFVLEGTTYRVRFLVHSSDGLWLGMDRELPADFTLLVADSYYRGSESMIPNSIDGVEAYWWPATPPDWLGDDPVRVGLTVHPDFPLGSRQKAPVTGYFHSFPTEHDWNEDVIFRINFSEGVATTAAALRDHVLSVSGGTVSSVEAVGDEGKTWAFSVTPASSEPIAVRIEADLDCALPGAICTPDGRRLFNRLELTVEAKEWNPPTGAPTIRGGTVEAGQTLTVDTSGIADADGLTGAAFRYQWELYDGNAYTDIQGATDSTYTLVPADEGKAFRVRVSFTDDAGYEESLTSGLYGSERPYGLSASASDGVVVLNWKLPAGWPYSSMFQILRNRPELGETGPLVHVRFAETTGTSYTDTDVEPGVLYVYRVKGVDPFGYTGEASQPAEVDPASVLVWEGELAAGQETGMIPVMSGYSSVGSPGGTLSPNRFVVDRTTYPVQFLIHASESLWLGMTGELPVDFTLRVGESAYRGSESMVPYTISMGAYWWPSPPPDWSADDPVQVSLTIRPDIPLGTRQKAPVTGHFRNVPPQHSGDEDFSFNIYFTEVVSTTAGRLRDHVLAVTGGVVSSVEAVEHDDRIWAVSVTPETTDTVTIEIEADLDCALSGAVCTSDGRRLFNRMELEVAGPPLTVDGPGPGPKNNPATGGAAIGGAAQVGETLTADTSGIADADGLQDATFSYQWVRGDGDTDSDIPGETGAIYVVKPGDAGKLIKVRVSFTDDEGNDETTTSAATAAVSATVPGTPRSLEVQTGGTGELAVTWQPPESNGGSEVTGYRVQWKLATGSWDTPANVSSATSTGTSYTITSLSLDTEYAVRVIAANGVGDSPASAEQRATARAQTSQQQASTSNTPATGTPTISGTAEVGETLSAHTSGISDDDGLANVSFNYQWLADEAEISGATGSTYILVADDEGKTIRVKVSFTDGNSNHESLASAATAAVAAAAPTNNEATGAPTIGGVVKVGHVLTADTTGISDPDGLDNASFDYQWLADDSAITGATGSAYLLVADDKGKAIKVKVFFTDDGDSDESLTSAATVAVTTSPLTVSLENEPDTPHDGQNPFTFELHFSEEFDLSYLTLKDDAFTVEGGEVTRARRIDRDSITPNIRWEITVRPTGDGEVTITLPETSDCNAEGAICTEDDRMLSDEVEFTVSGPE